MVFATMLTTDALFGQVAVQVPSQPAPRQVLKILGPSPQALIDNRFAQWDRDGDMVLSLKELNALIEAPAVRDSEAAAVAALRKRIPKQQPRFPGFSRLRLNDLAKDRGYISMYGSDLLRLRAAHRTLFMAGDPNLRAFQQGVVGDCYLLAAVAGLVNRDRQAVRAMIIPLSGGTNEVHFGSGRVCIVPPLTDAELLLGARIASDRGIWLNVIEKAFASIREERREARTGTLLEGDDVASPDLLGGGNPRAVVTLLTGHLTSRAPVDVWRKDGQGDPEARLHDLLVRLTAAHRIMTTCTAKNPRVALPQGISHSHCFTVLGYDSARKMVRLFNPYGPTHKPKGVAGLKNGYATTQGVFEVPIQDYVRIFPGVSYEIDKSAGK